MKNSNTSPEAPERTAAATDQRSASAPRRRETVEEAVARVRAIPGFLQEIGPEAIAQFQREAAKHHEVMGFLPPIKQQKQKKKRR